MHLVVTRQADVVLTERERMHMNQSRAVLQQFVDQRLPVYGVSTQFGDDAHRVHISGDYDDYLQSLVRRQNNVIQALGCELGEESTEEIIRATMLLRIHALAQGASGVRPEIVDAILELLRHDILPVLRRYGSVGASGDLIPLSALARVLTGGHQVRHGGKLLPASEGLRLAGIRPMLLQMKEGLAIVNGTSFSTALAAYATHKLCHLLPLSIAASAACAEAMRVMDSGYCAFVHESKHHRGSIQIANFVRLCWENSSLIRSLDALRGEWRDSLLSRGTAAQEHVQDFYSLRSIAQGFGPFYDDLERAVPWVENEMNSANDNPIIQVKENRIYHGANFLSDYIATICDQLRADIAKGSTWMHALLGNLVHPRKNRGLPANLVSDPEEYTGFKTIQLLAASLAIHNRSRSLPVAAVMLPTEGDNQDMVSLGTHSALDLLEVTENYARLTGIMCVAAAQALELRGIEKAGRVSRDIHAFVRRYVPFLGRDRALGDELAVLTDALWNDASVVVPWFLQGSTGTREPEI